LELREYWAILARRWQLIGVVTALAFVASAAMIMLGPSNYQAELRLSVGIKPETRQGNYYMYDQYYTWLTSEYMVDDFGEVVKSDTFARDVSARLGQRVPAGSIKRDLKVTRTHRILTVDITTDNPNLSQDIGQAIKDTMESQGSSYFAELQTQGASIQVIDDPVVAPEMGPARRALEIGLRTVVGLLAAVALAFLLHYLDPTVRTTAEAERHFGLPVLAEIPR
jgi:capsular polysaccharide biosynthesis protein